MDVFCVRGEIRGLQGVPLSSDTHSDFLHMLVLSIKKGLSIKELFVVLSNLLLLPLTHNLHRWHTKKPITLQPDSVPCLQAPAGTTQGGELEYCC